VRNQALIPQTVVTEFKNLDAALVDHGARCQALHRDCQKRNAPAVPDPFETLDVVKNELPVVASEKSGAQPIVKTEPPVVRLPQKKKYESKEGGVQFIVKTEVPVVRLPQKKMLCRHSSPAGDLILADLRKAEEQYLPLISAGMEIRKRNSVV
jgi:hypothetical protein